MKRRVDSVETNEGGVRHPWICAVIPAAISAMTKIEVRVAEEDEAEVVEEAGEEEEEEEEEEGEVEEAEEREEEQEEEEEEEEEGEIYRHARLEIWIARDKIT